MEFNSEAQRMAVKAAFIRITSDQSWQVLRVFADDCVRELEQKALMEDNEDKAKTYRHDARGARKFWDNFLRQIDLAKGAESGENFLEVVM